MKKKVHLRGKRHYTEHQGSNFYSTSLSLIMVSQNRCVWADINPYKARGAKVREKTRTSTFSPAAHSFTQTSPIQRRLYKRDAFQVLGSSSGETSLWCILRRAAKCQVSVRSNYCEPANLFGPNPRCDRKLSWFYCQGGTKIHLMFAYYFCFSKLIK